MRSKRKPSPEPEVEQANLLPVMNIMFLLIPGLLLAMETASMAAISVSSPMSTEPRGKPKPTAAEEKVEVELRGDSILVRHGEAVIDTLAVLPGGPDERGGPRFDFEALTATAGKLHAAIPSTTRVTVRAENDIELDDLVMAMDALRGPQCESPGRGEADAQCWFWQPVLQSY